MVGHTRSIHQSAKPKRQNPHHQVHPRMAADEPSPLQVRTRRDRDLYRVLNQRRRQHPSNTVPRSQSTSDPRQMDNSTNNFSTPIKDASADTGDYRV